MTGFEHMIVEALLEQVRQARHVGNPAEPQQRLADMIEAGEYRLVRVED